MIVRELLALLGLEVDEASFDAADLAVAAVEKGLWVVGAAATAAAAAITAMVDEAGMLADTSERLGVDVERLQELGAAAQMSGSDLTNMSQALLVLAKNAASARDGNEDMTKAFRDAGVELKDSAGNLRPLDDLLLQLSAKVASMPPGAERAALALDLLGKGGISLIPLLKEGPAGIASLTREARELGAVMGADTVEAGDELGDTIDRLQLSLKGIRNLIGAPLLQPVLELARGVLEWAKANREIIASSIERVVRVSVSAIKLALQVASPFAVLLKVLALDAGGLNVALVLLSVALLIYSGNAIRSAIVSTVAFIASMKAKITVTEVYTNLLGKTTTAVRLMTLAELRAAAVTALAPYAIAAAWGALFILLGLLVEDIYVAFQGGDSVFTRWAKWIDNALRYEDDDSGLVRYLKWIGLLFFDNMKATEIFQAKVRSLFSGVADWFREWRDEIESFWNAVGKGDWGKAGDVFTKLLGPFGTWLSWVGGIFDTIGNWILWFVNVGGRAFEGIGKMLGAFAAGEGKEGVRSLLEGFGAVGDWAGQIKWTEDEASLDRWLGRGAKGSTSVAGAAGAGISRSNVNAPAFTYSPTINVGPGTSPEAVAETGRTGFEQWMDAQLRTALANGEGG